MKNLLLFLIPVIVIGAIVHDTLAYTPSRPTIERLE